MNLNQIVNKAVGKEIDLEKILDAAESAEPNLKDQIEAVRTAVRSGLDPAGVLAVVKEALPELLDIAHGHIHPTDHAGDGL